MSRPRIPKATRAVIEEAIANGWAVDNTRNGHLRLTHPKHGMIFTPSSPSDWRGSRNLRAQIRRAERNT